MLLEVSGLNPRLTIASASSRAVGVGQIFRLHGKLGAGSCNLMDALQVSVSGMQGIEG